MPSIRILLADDHPLIRAGVRTTLDAEAGLSLIGEAMNARQAQELSLQLGPDVLLLDLNMPGPSPLETVAYLQQHCPAMKIIILTAYDDPGYLRPLLRLGIAGYVLKDEGTKALVRAIQTVIQGDTWFSRSIVDKLAHSPTAEPKMRGEINLTQREQQVLRLMVRGLDNNQIGTELHLAEQTVRNYVSRIYAQLGVHSRPEAIQWAHQHNLL